VIYCHSGGPGLRTVPPKSKLPPSHQTCLISLKTFLVSLGIHLITLKSFLAICTVTTTVLNCSNPMPVFKSNDVVDWYCQSLHLRISSEVDLHMWQYLSLDKTCKITRKLVNQYNMKIKPSENKREFTILHYTVADRYTTIIAQLLRAEGMGAEPHTLENLVTHQSKKFQLSCDSLCICPYVRPYATCTARA